MDKVQVLANGPVLFEGKTYEEGETLYVTAELAVWLEEVKAAKRVPSRVLEPVSEPKNFGSKASK